jgi:RHS repeat-associated protein
MKAYISSIAALLLAAQGASAQAPTSSKNHVVETTVKVPGKTTAAQLPGLTSWEASRTIQYLDGLGRPQQSVQWQGSPKQRDIVQPIIYDAFGREEKKYLPYAEQTGNDGSFKANALGNQASFYGNGSWDDNIARTAYPFSQTVFEPSPLNRMLQQGAPGLSWQPSSSRGTTGRTVVTDYAANTAGDAVKLWNVVTSGATGTQTYPAGKLYKQVTKDENWVSGKLNTTEEFRDMEGRVVLKRVWETVETMEISRDTYYIYDNLGNLRYVLPPAVNVSSFVVTDDIFTKFIYGYNYDGRNRVYEKHIPGKGWEHMVYNRIDQVVMSQDGNLRAQLKWAFTKYDVHGRAVITGIVTDDITRAALQSRFDNIALTPVIWESRDDANASGTGTGYTGSVYPNITLANCMVINYYDDYAFQGNTIAKPSGTSDKLKGLATASRVRVIDGELLLNNTYYDDEGRVVETMAQSHLTSGNDRVKNTYSFAGELISSLRTHTKGSEITTIANVYVYDHMGRRRHNKQNINNKGGVWLNRIDYNEIGQMKQKALHSDNQGLSFLQSTKYAYNERGWLKNSESPQFGMKLGYDTLGASQAQYNGNISVQRWGSSYTNQFLYTYDPLNRLKNATSTGVAMSEALTYDEMGNISSLSRDNGLPSTYNYNGNKLTNITGGSITTGTYTYLNGNATTDGRTGASLTYNHLNLPKTAVKSGLNLSYTYNALGQKLKKVNSITSTTNDYVDGIQYTNGAIDFIQTEEGIARNSGGTYSYEYNLTDHLGNVRYSFSKNPSTGAISPLQADDYYAFGLRKVATPGNNKYLYNGKELQEELAQYDYGARFYDPVIGRWNVVDPLAELGRRWSPYTYCFNNPIIFVDPDGMAADSALKTINLSEVKITANKIKDFAVGILIRTGARIGTGWAIEVLNPEPVTKSIGAVAMSVYSIYSFIDEVNIALTPKAIVPIGSYTITTRNGKKYHGKGSWARAKQSAKKISRDYGDTPVSVEWTPAESDRQGFKDEDQRIEQDGGHKDQGNYNKRASPGKKYKVLDAKSTE